MTRFKGKATLGFANAPVSGGQAGAENGLLSVAFDGKQAQYDAAEAVLAAYARICHCIVDSGAGRITKICNQITITDLFQGLSDALDFAKKSARTARR